MTVIVYRDGIVAADSAAWQGSCIVSQNKRKIYRLKDGSLYAGSGHSAVIQAVAQWLNGGERPDKEADGEYEGLLINDAGEAKGITNSMLIYDRAPAPYHFVGPGFLMGALAMGATAQRAVELAIMHLDCAAGEVHFERL